MNSSRLCQSGLIAISFALSSPPASAAVHDTYRSGVWRAFEGLSEPNMKPMCGAGTGGTDGRGFYIKYFSGDDKMSLHIFKSGWNIPDQQTVRIKFAIDKASPWTANALAFQNHLEITIPTSHFDEFINEIRFGVRLNVWFLDGNEGAWFGGLSGSNGAMLTLIQCMQRIIPPSTQPFNPTPSPGRQNFNPVMPTQPYTPPSSPERKNTDPARLIEPSAPTIRSDLSSVNQADSAG